MREKTMNTEQKQAFKLFLAKDRIALELLQERSNIDYELSTLRIAPSPLALYIQALIDVLSIPQKKDI